MIRRSPRPHDPAEGFSFRFVGPLALGATLNPLNSTMIATALVLIADDIGVPMTEISWLIAGLYIASAIAQPTMGKLADLFGPRRVYLFSLVLVALAGLVGQLANGLFGLVASRVLLGIGTSGAYPSAMRLFRERADLIGGPPPRKAMGMLSLAALSSAAFGPLLGGVMTHWLGWHAIFSINIPLALITLLLVRAGIPPASPRVTHWRRVVLDIDPVGMLLFTAALMTLLLWLFEADRLGYWVLAASVFLWPVFVIHSLRQTTPFINMRMLIGNLPLSLTYLRASALMMVVYCIVYGYTQWLQSIGYSSAEAGLFMLPIATVSAASSLIGARTKGIRGPFLFSIVCALAGSALLLTLHTSSPVWAIVAVGLLFGPPQGMFMTATQAAVYVQSSADDIGTAAGLQRSAQYIGAIGAATALANIFGQRASDTGLHHLGMMMGSLCAAALLLTILDRTIPRGAVG